MPSQSPLLRGPYYLVASISYTSAVQEDIVAMFFFSTSGKEYRRRSIGENKRGGERGGGGWWLLIVIFVAVKCLGLAYNRWEQMVI